MKKKFKVGTADLLPDEFDIKHMKIYVEVMFTGENYEYLKSLKKRKGSIRESISAAINEIIEDQRNHY